MSGDPTGREVGVKLAIVGVGKLLMVSVAACDRPPPGAPETTVTCAAPGLAMSDTPSVAVRVDPLTKVVGRAAPFSCTTEDEMNPVPFTVSVNG